MATPETSPNLLRRSIPFLVGCIAAYTLFKLLPHRPSVRGLEEGKRALTTQREQRMSEPPIQDLDNVDLVGERHDGGVELIIVTSRRLDASSETQQLLLQKIRSYLEQLNTPAFQAEFHSPPPDKTLIIVSCKQEPDPVVRQLMANADGWVRENNARLELRVDP